MTNKILKVVAPILLAIITAIILRSCFPEKAHIGNIEHKISGQSIVIIPTSGIPMQFLRNLESTLEKQHKTDVLVTTAMGKGKEMLLVDSDQYNADYLAGVGTTIGKRIARNGAFIVVLTNEDINYPESGLRYVFSSHYDGISVVSLARISSLNFGAKIDLLSAPEAFSNIMERSLKLINKAIGYEAYGYEVSSNINSVMYGPIMGVNDLDQVGSWY